MAIALLAIGWATASPLLAGPKKPGSTINACKLLPAGLLASAGITGGCDASTHKTPGATSYVGRWGTGKDNHYLGISIDKLASTGAKRALAQKLIVGQIKKAGPSVGIGVASGLSSDTYEDERLGMIAQAELQFFSHGYAVQMAINDGPSVEAEELEGNLTLLGFALNSKL